MNITQESTGQLTATIHINLEETDYQENVEKTLREHRRKVTMPGFRPGMVPYGMIKRMYGKAILAEEIQKLISENLEKYIKDHQLDILGQPLSSQERNEKIDFENQTSFDFYFDIGLSPEIDLELNDSLEVPYHTIAVDDKMVDDSVSDILRRHGTLVDTETAGQEDTVRGEITELDENGEPKRDGIIHNTIIAVNYVKDDSIREQFIGKGKGDVIVFNPLTATGDAVETAQMLGIKKEHAEILTSDFRLTIDQVQRLQPAQLNEELYQQLFPAEKIATEKEFRELLRKDIARSMTPETDQQFMNGVIRMLMERSNIQLPDEFLKRYLLEANENKASKDDIERDYDKYAKSLKWQLLENKLIREHNLGVSEEEIRDYILGYFKARYPEEKHEHEHGHEHETGLEEEPAAESISPGEKDDDAKYRSLVDYVMKNEEEVRKINDHLFDLKLRELFKNKLKVNYSEVPISEFIRLTEETKNQNTRL
ncbi:MAG TPA: trigger factor [Bacteroidales bacterium]|nr:trigger factor [Bacteroidales bacterium]HNS47781.1 trigger factor [Bacteroidales bacterium]